MSSDCSTHSRFDEATETIVKLHIYQVNVISNIDQYILFWSKTSSQEL